MKALTAKEKSKPLLILGIFAGLGIGSPNAENGAGKDPRMAPEQRVLAAFLEDARTKVEAIRD